MKTMTGRFWVFNSDSTPGKKYQVLEWNAMEFKPKGTLVAELLYSCDCPGWTRRNPPTGRTCKHVRLVMSGEAYEQRADSRQLAKRLPVAAQHSQPTKETEQPKAGRAFDFNL